MRDVTLIAQEDNSVALKFNASNTGIQGNEITCENIDVQDAEIDSTPPPRCAPTAAWSPMPRPPWKR